MGLHVGERQDAVHGEAREQQRLAANPVSWPSPSNLEQGSWPAIHAAVVMPIWLTLMPCPCI